MTQPEEDTPVTGTRTSPPDHRIGGVLFDIDDTLVDLETAMGNTLQHVSARLLPGLSDDDWVEYKRLFVDDPLRHYERYLAGELSFVEQRIERARHAHGRVGAEPFDADTAAQWNTAYEATLSLHFAPFPDVGPVLDELDALGIPYGAVSNNVHDYQRAKLDQAGLQRIRILVGIDTVGVAKPDPAIFLEGTRLLGTEPGRTLYVGDNLEIDAVGATAAGMVGIWLNRNGRGAEGYDGAQLKDLSQLFEMFITQ
jgi:putative hydrolase of the HAD superfamily